MDSVEEWLANHHAQNLALILPPWLATTRATLLDTLHSPTLDDVPLFVSLALKHDSVAFLRDRYGFQLL